MKTNLVLRNNEINLKMKVQTELQIILPGSFWEFLSKKLSPRGFSFLSKAVEKLEAENCTTFKNRKLARE